MGSAIAHAAVVAAGLGLAAQLALHAQTGPTESALSSADAVVVATVQITGSGQTTLSVVRNVKGDLMTGDALAIAPLTSACPGGMSTPTFGLFFLKRAGLQWSVLKPQPNAFLGPCGIALPSASSPTTVRTTAVPSTAADHLAVELLAGLENYTDKSQLPPLASMLVGIQGSTLVPGVLQSLHASSDPELRFIGVLGLLTAPDDAAALSEIAGNLDLVSTLSSRTLLASSICGQLNTDAAAVKAIGAISASNDLGFQSCAAMALSLIHTRASLPFLAQLLNNQNTFVREQAMKGLSRFCDNLPAATAVNMINGRGVLSQGSSPYSTPGTRKYSLSVSSLNASPYPESEFLQFWSDWWTSVGRTIPSGP